MSWGLLGAWLASTAVVYVVYTLYRASQAQALLMLPAPSSLPRQLVSRRDVPSALAGGLDELEQAWIELGFGPLACIVYPRCVDAYALRADGTVASVRIERRPLGALAQSAFCTARIADGRSVVVGHRTPAIGAPDPRCVGAVVPDDFAPALLPKVHEALCARIGVRPAPLDVSLERWLEDHARRYYEHQLETGAYHRRPGSDVLEASFATALRWIIVDHSALAPLLAHLTRVRARRNVAALHGATWSAFAMPTARPLAPHAGDAADSERR